MIRSLFETKIEDISAMLDKYPFENKQACHLFFSQQYYLIQNSTRYEAIGASLLPFERKEEFQERIQHLTGEFNHDDLIIDDLNKLGYSELLPISPPTKSLVAFIYYELETKGADALFGISLLLEGLSTKQCSKVGTRIKKSFGVDSEYLSVHDEADRVHFPNTMKMIENFAQNRHTAIIDNLEVSHFLYSSMIKHCLSQLEKAHLRQVV